MSLYFLSEREQNQAQEDAFAPPQSDENLPWVDWDETKSRLARGFDTLDMTFSRLGELFSNFPNTALETPSYLLPEDPVQRAATRRITDPNYGRRTVLADYFYDHGEAARQDYLSRQSHAQLSTSASIIADLAEGLPPLLVGPAGGTTGVVASAIGSSYEGQHADLVSQGVDESTARETAATGAVIGGAGYLAPAGIGTQLWQRIVTGAAMNAAAGAGGRYAVSESLRHNGYDELAERYDWRDKHALVVDALLGAAFGGGWRA